jgi:hypothetical protein
MERCGSSGSAEYRQNEYKQAYQSFHAVQTVSAAHKHAQKQNPNNLIGTFLPIVKQIFPSTCRGGLKPLRGLRMEFALCANSGGLYPTINQAYRRSFAQQNSILNTACGVETTCRGGTWGRHDVNGRRFPPSGE